MLETTIEVILVLVAFILGYFTHFFQDAWNTVRNYKWVGVRAVLKALTSVRTYIPIVFTLVLIGAVIGLNYWQGHLEDKNRNTQNNEIIESINRHNDDKFQAILDRIDKLITILEEQNVSNNTTTDPETK